MILKDLMEEKQINFNQPLLSVRRFSSTVASETDNKRRNNTLPAYKSELKSGPVRNAGTVPFVWEKTPGRPKDESKLQTQAYEQPPITPNLPPGRVSKVKQQDSDIVSKGASSVTEMRARSTLSNSQIVASLGKKVTKHESSKDGIQEKGSSDSDDGDEIYQDALDTLSRTESFFMSCSVSDLSGWDDQTRDFMVDRFLPAAKTMISETPQYVSKKPLVGQEQQKQLKKVASTESSLPLNQHRLKSLRHYTQDIDSEGSEDENDDCNGYENNTTTACGLLPRCCLLNPFPGLRMEDKVQSNAVSRTQTKSTASHLETTKERVRAPYYGNKSLDSQYGFTEEKEILGILEKSKHATDPHRRGCSKLLANESTQRESSYESPLVEKTLYVDSVHKVMSQTNHKGDTFDTLRRDSDLIKNRSVDYSLENSTRLDVVNVKAALQPKSSESLDSSFLVCSENSSNGMQMEMTNQVVECIKINLESQVHRSETNSGIFPIQNSEVDLKNQLAAKTNQECTLASSKVEDNGKIDLESQCVMKFGHQETYDASYFELPLVLASLKAPSESWLKRTLPTISSRNISSRSSIAANIYARSQTPKTASLYPKWETKVESSNVHHGHLQLPEELLKSIPED